MNVQTDYQASYLYNFGYSPPFPSGRIGFICRMPQPLFLTTGETRMPPDRVPGIPFNQAKSVYKVGHWIQHPLELALCQVYRFVCNIGM